MPIRGPMSSPSARAPAPPHHPSIQLWQSGTWGVRHLERAAPNMTADTMGKDGTCGQGFRLEMANIVLPAPISRVCDLQHLSEPAIRSKQIRSSESKRLQLVAASWFCLHFSALDTPNQCQSENYPRAPPDSARHLLKSPQTTARKLSMSIREDSPSSLLPPVLS